MENKDVDKVYFSKLLLLLLLLFFPFNSLATLTSLIVSSIAALSVPPLSVSAVPPSTDLTVPSSSTPTVASSSAPIVPSSSTPTVPSSSTPTVPSSALTGWGRVFIKNFNENKLFLMLGCIKPSPPHPPPSLTYVSHIIGGLI
ncbi:ponticulin-like protein H [Hydra vulgaris]|uniref:ponticulin-like protein H n=1 Tax=Hydra vulgaris TaxID=6087 RepID=UPI0032EA53C4